MSWIDEQRETHRELLTWAQHSGQQLRRIQREMPGHRVIQEACTVGLQLAQLADHVATHPRYTEVGRAQTLASIEQRLRNAVAVVSEEAQREEWAA